MKFERVLEILNLASYTLEFISFEKLLGNNMTDGLVHGYQTAPTRKLEEYLVRELVSAINTTGRHTISKKYRITAEPRAMFIHGRKSEVKYDMNSNVKNVRRELGDLIFIATLTLGSSRVFERVSICQAKRSTPVAATRWSIDKAQLYLLSRFPQFESIGTLLPKGNYVFGNRSQCLGAFGFMYSPGDFIFAAAPLVESITGPVVKTGTKSVDSRNLELYSRSSLGVYYMPLWLWYPEFYWLTQRIGAPPTVLLNCLYSKNTYDFSSNFVRMNIGEVCFDPRGFYDRSVLVFIRSLFQNIQSQKGTLKISGNSNLVDHYLTDYEDYGVKSSSDTIPPSESLNPASFDGDLGRLGIVHLDLNMSKFD